MAQTRQGMRRSERIRNKKATNEAKKVLPPKKAQQRSVRKREQKPKKQSAKQRPVSKRNPPREPTSPPPKPPCSSPPHLHPRPEAAKETSVYHWIENGTWPHELFEPTMAQQQDLCSSKQTTKTKTISYPSRAALNFLQSHNSFLRPHPNNMSDEDKQLYEKLLARPCKLPENTLLDDKLLSYLEDRIGMRNETGLFLLLHQTVVPVAEIETLRGNVVPNHLMDTFNEAWDCSIPLPLKPNEIGLPTPQPDHSVGFSIHAFTTLQQEKMRPLLGEPGNQSPFKATDEMLFPFLSAETKSSAAPLFPAARQSGHCMTRSLKGIIRLFQEVGKVEDLDRKMLGFSVLYNHQTVEIFAHYVVLRKLQQGQVQPECYRSSIANTGFRVPDKWASYKFVLAIYNDWAPRHLSFLCTAIDAMPYKDGSENAAQPIDLSS